MAVVLVKIGKKYYKARINPHRPRMSAADLAKYATLLRYYKRASKDGKLALMIRLERRIKRMDAEKRINPLLKSRSKASIGKNISWLMHHPKELTAKTKLMQHKQAIAIALSVWRKATGKKR